MQVWSQHYYLGVAYEAAGKLPEAMAEYRRAVELSDDSRPVIALAHGYSAQGKTAEANQLLRDLERKAKDASLSPYTMATMCVALGENEKAFQFLEKAYTDKSFDMSFSLRSDPLLDPLRSDPRFQSLLRRVGLNS